MSEKEKMLDGHLYQPYSSELYKDREFCQGMLYEYNRLSPLHRDERDLILKKLLKCKGELNSLFIVVMDIILKLV